MLRDFVCFRKFELNVIQMSKLDLERKDIRFRRECIEINDSYAFWQAYCPQLAPLCKLLPHGLKAKLAQNFVTSSLFQASWRRKLGTAWEVSLFI